MGKSGIMTRLGACGSRLAKKAGDVLLDDIFLSVAGLVSLSVGAGMAWLPAGPMVAGAGLLAEVIWSKLGGEDECPRH
jgi:hypothetical protein